MQNELPATAHSEKQQTDGGASPVRFESASRTESWKTLHSTATVPTWSRADPEDDNNNPTGPLPPHYPGISERNDGAAQQL